MTPTCFSGRWRVGVRRQQHRERTGLLVGRQPVQAADLTGLPTSLPVTSMVRLIRSLGMSTLKIFLMSAALRIAPQSTLSGSIPVTTGAATTAVGDGEGDGLGDGSTLAAVSPLAGSAAGGSIRRDRGGAVRAAGYGDHRGDGAPGTRGVGATGGNDQNPGDSRGEHKVTSHVSTVMVGTGPTCSSQRRLHNVSVTVTGRTTCSGAVH